MLRPICNSDMKARTLLLLAGFAASAVMANKVVAGTTGDQPPGVVLVPPPPIIAPLPPPVLLELPKATVDGGGQTDNKKELPRSQAKRRQPASAASATVKV